MTFIIAEVGSNFGEYKDLKHSCVMAKKAGADAVKFQCFSERSLYGYGNSHPNLAYEWIPKLKDLCDGLDIEFMCTAFDEEALLYINKYVKRHKLASSEMRHTGLIESIKRTGKPCLVSVGGHSFDRIEKTVRDFKDHDITLLYCSNAYPSKLHDLEVIHALRDRFKRPVGFSDHTIDCFTAACAVRNYQASVVEKHVRFCDIDSPDRGHSVNFDEFSELVKRIRGESSISHPQRDEQDAVKMHNRRLIATTTINIGDALCLGRNVGIYRSRHKNSKYLDPEVGKTIEGTRATVGLMPGDALGPGDFK